MAEAVADPTPQMEDSKNEAVDTEFSEAFAPGATEVVENGESKNDSEVNKPDEVVAKEECVTDDTRTEEKMDIQESEKDEFIELSGDHGFDTDILEEEEKDIHEVDEDVHEGDGEHDDDMKEDDDDEDEEEEDEEDPDGTSSVNQDPNVMPQVNVTVLAQRKWQVKVYPLKPADFDSGHISRVFKNARESLLYLLGHVPGKDSRGKGEMYLATVNQTVKCVQSLMRMDYFHPEINVEIIKKNDQGAIEEKAYLRFDSKLARILTIRPSFRRGPPGRKGDRLIGSVFVKNLPPGTTKDTLRVMFPFAQEINYNPEKFKDCTARLVLHYRSHVIPCLKAFAKVELGGNVLELHPLSKRKRERIGSDDDDEEMPEIKQKRKSELPNSSAAKKDESKAKQTVKKEATRKDSKEKSDSKPKEEKKEKEEDKLNQNKKPRTNKPLGPKRDGKADDTRRPKLIGGKEISTTPKTSSRGGRGRQERSLASSARFRDDRNRNREFTNSQRRFANARNSRFRGGSVGRGRQSNMGRSSYSMGMGASAVAASDANLAINAEATKEMVLLQNQLSMAIKNQLTMLNQTQMAVENAKRGASSMGLGDADMPPPRSSPKDFGGSMPSRRSLDQYRSASSLDGDNRYTSRSQTRTKPSPRRGSSSSSGTRGNVNPKRGGGDFNKRSSSDFISKRGGGGGGGAANYGNRGVGGRGGGGSSKSGGYPKRGGNRGGGGSSGSAYSKRGGGSSSGAGRGGFGKSRVNSYRQDEEEEWDRLSSTQMRNSYNQDYYYDREASYADSYSGGGYY